MQNNNESNVRFSDLLSLFVSKLWLMILVAVIVSGSLFAYRYYTYEPMYESKATVHVLPQTDLNDTYDYNSELNAGLNIVEDCKKFLISHRVIDEVIRQNELPYTYAELVSMVTISSEPDSRIIEIVVKCSDKDEAKLIADSICVIGEQAIDVKLKFDTVEIWDQGNLPTTPCNSIFSYVIILGGLVGFILTYIVIVLLYIFDDKVSDPDLVEKNLGLTVLALIPNMKKDNKKGEYFYQSKNTAQRHRYYQKGGKGNR